MRTQHQRGQVGVVRVQVLKAQGLGDELVHGVHAHHQTDTDHNGVVGLADRIIHQHDGAIAADIPEVHRPGAPDVVARLVGRVGGVQRQAEAQRLLGVQHLFVLGRIQRRILQRAGVIDPLFINAQAVGRDGLHGRTGLVGFHRTVDAPVHRLGAQAAAHGDDLALLVKLAADHRNGRLGAHVAVEGQVFAGNVPVFVGGFVGAGLEGAVVVVNRGIIRPEDGPGGLVCGVHRHPVGIKAVFAAHRDVAFHLFLMPQGREEHVAVFVRFVEHQVFHRSLNVRVHRGVHAQTGGEDIVLGLGIALKPVGFLDVLGQFFQRGLGEVGVVGLHRHILGLGLALGQGDRFLGGGIVFFLGDIALVQHLPQHMVAAGDEVFRVGGRVVAGGVLGYGGQGGALGQGQFLHALVEVFPGAGLHPFDGAGQGHGVEVGFQDGLLAVAVAQADGAEDLAEFTAVIHRGVIGQVFDHLLFQRGRALLGAQQALAGDLVEGGGDGALEVDADLIVEILVLNGDDRVLQIFRNVRQIAPEGTAAARREGGILVAVAIVEDRGLGALSAFQVQLAFRVGRDLHHIHRKQYRRHAAGHDPHAEQAADKADDVAEDTAALFGFGFPGALAGALGPGTRCFCALGGKVPLLFGVYGDRLLLRIQIPSGCAAECGTQEWTIP